jgi:hypothetical protein
MATSRHFRSNNPALFDASGFAAHLYTAGQVASPGRADPVSEPDYAGLVDLGKLERTLDRLTRVYGSHVRFPIYNTEFGFQTNPPAPLCDCVFLKPVTAGYYLNWSEYIMYRNPRVRSDAQYLLSDDFAPGTNLGVFSTGLLFPSGAEKADYRAFRIPLYLPVTATASGHSLEVWGAVRPAQFAEHDADALQRVRIEFRATASDAWAAVRTVTIRNPEGYFQARVVFPSSGSVRLAWTYPSGFAFLPFLPEPTVFSRTQAITILERPDLRDAGRA